MTKEDFKALRKSERKTQMQMAEYLGVTESAVAKWEKGTNSIPPAVEKLLRSPNRLELDMETLEAVHKHAMKKGCSFTEAIHDLVRVGIKTLSLLIFAAIIGATICLASGEWSEKASRFATSLEEALAYVPQAVGYMAKLAS
jgi:transcriptional regulator with XRE-family HTH domain